MRISPVWHLLLLLREAARDVRTYPPGPRVRCGQEEDSARPGHGFQTCPKQKLDLLYARFPTLDSADIYIHKPPLLLLLLLPSA